MGPTLVSCYLGSFDGSTESKSKDVTQHTKEACDEQSVRRKATTVKRTDA